MSRARSAASAVVLIPPEPLWPEIQALRRRHDRHVHRWMPHVTLLFPFVPHDDFGGARTRLARVARTLAPFDVRLASVRCFRHDVGSTLWLAPEPAAPVARAQQALWEAFPAHDDTRRYPGGFTPHLSIGQAASDEAAGLADAIAARWRPLAWRVDCFALIAREDRPESVFRVDWAFSLGG